MQPEPARRSTSSNTRQPSLARAADAARWVQSCAWALTVRLNTLFVEHNYWAHHSGPFTLPPRLREDRRSRDRWLAVGRARARAQPSACFKPKSGPPFLLARNVRWSCERETRFLLSPPPTQTLIPSTSHRGFLLAYTVAAESCAGSQGRVPKRMKRSNKTLDLK